MTAIDGEKGKSDDVKYILDFYKVLNDNWRHYDSHLWQIPSVAIAINVFLIAQSFSENLQDYLYVRAIVVFVSALFTLVLLIALVKHRLHQQSQSENKKANLKLLQDKLPIVYQEFDFSESKNLITVEGNDIFVIQKLFAGQKAHKWLMFVMFATLLMDLVILGGIVLCYW